MSALFSNSRFSKDVLNAHETSGFVFWVFRKVRKKRKKMIKKLQKNSSENGAKKELKKRKKSANFVIDQKTKSRFLKSPRKGSDIRFSKPHL